MLLTRIVIKIAIWSKIYWNKKFRSNLIYECMLTSFIFNTIILIKLFF